MYRYADTLSKWTWSYDQVEQQHVIHWQADKGMQEVEE